MNEEDAKKKAIAEALGLGEVVHTFAQLFPEHFRITILVRDPSTDETRFFMTNEKHGAHDKVAECIVKTMTDKVEIGPDVDVVVVGSDISGLSH